MALLDDIWCVSSPIRTATGFTAIQEELLTVGIRVHDGKTQLWNRSGQVPAGVEALTAAARRSDPDAMADTTFGPNDFWPSRLLGPDNFWPKPLLARFRSPKIAQRSDHFWPAQSLTIFGPRQLLAHNFWPTTTTEQKLNSVFV